LRIIGFDFGTTNSTISFFNDETGALDNFKIDAAGNDYIPTVVAYDIKNPKDISIGRPAKLKLTQPKSYESYENFKLRLGRHFDKVIDGKTKTPIHVTRDYIEILLETYKKGQNISKIDRLVMTVPETWFTEASNRTARENIEEIYRQLGYSEYEFQLESEPVAAAVYFCWAFLNDSKKNPNKKEYEGFITVVDYGGGTLDVTLCQVEKGKDKSRIKILERFGYGEYNETNGCAGVAFDEAVVDRLIKANGLPIQKGSPRFIKLRSAFEELKIAECEKITKEMNDYLDDPDLVEGKVLFSIEYNEDGDTMDVTCEDLYNSFEAINAPELRKSLEKVSQFFNAHKIDSSRQDNFRVLLVGGFSNFVLSEEVVRNFFGAKSSFKDKRFEQPFPILNRALAISRGAALIDDNIVHTCTHTFGYVIHTPVESDRFMPTYIPVIKKGTDVKEVANPVYSQAALQIYHGAGTLRIYMDDGRPDGAGVLSAALDKSVSELFPNVSDKGNLYNIGFSVNKNIIPTIHIKDKKGAVISTSLNKLIEKLAIVQK
jgi:molecular chaperone DnaK